MLNYLHVNQFILRHYFFANLHAWLCQYIYAFNFVLHIQHSAILYCCITKSLESRSSIQLTSSSNSYFGIGNPCSFFRSYKERNAILSIDSMKLIMTLIFIITQLYNSFGQQSHPLDLQSPSRTSSAVGSTSPSLHASYRPMGGTHASVRDLMLPAHVNWIMQLTSPANPWIPNILTFYPWTNYICSHLHAANNKELFPDSNIAFLWHQWVDVHIRSINTNQNLTLFWFYINDLEMPL